MEQEQVKLNTAAQEEASPEYEGITLFPTKAGHGFKVIHDGEWFYARKEDVIAVVNRTQKACTFTTIKDKLPA